MEQSISFTDKESKIVKAFTEVMYHKFREETFDKCTLSLDLSTGKNTGSMEIIIGVSKIILDGEVCYEGSVIDKSELDTESFLKKVTNESADEDDYDALHFNCRAYPNCDINPEYCNHASNKIEKEKKK